MTRILLVGDLRGHTRTAQRLRALRELGHEVEAVTTAPLDQGPPDGRPAPLSDRLRHRLGVPRDATGAGSSLLRALAGAAFDVLWVEKALGLRDGVLREARRLAPETRLAYFSEDDMARRANGSRWFRAALPLYDVVFTTKSHNAHGELAALGARRVVLVTKSFDRHLHRPVRVSAGERARLGAAVGFIGTYEGERAAAIANLARAGVRVRVWGNGWEACRDRPAALRVEGRAIYGEEYVKALASTDVNLGFLRKANRDRHTDRSVEIPACGAFLLAERSDEHHALFEEGLEAEFFASDAELAAKVERYTRDAAARRRVARAGRARCLASGYDHHRALERMLREVASEARAA